MRPVGFSTGALAYADFRKGLEMLRHKNVQAVELSALRQNELIPLLEAIPTLDLAAFRHIAIHAPSKFEPEWEAALCDRLGEQRARGWPIVVHPDAILYFDLWRELKGSVCIENMDKRKPTGRSVRELDTIFNELPEASFCFDIGHARQFDPSMTEAWLILKEFGSRLCQVHVSEVNTRSKHDVLSFASIQAFQEVAHLIPVNIPLILETPVAEEDMEEEIARLLQALPEERGVMAA
jgi:hypothetical protein